MTDYFYHTGIESECCYELLEHSNNPWHYDALSLIHAMQVPNELLDSFLIDVKEQFQGVALLFKLPAHTFYGWHVDRKRQCCINLELNETLSSTYFGKKNEREIYDNLVRLNYENQYVLLNTQEWHSVANTGEARILFSLGFNNTAYDNVLAYLNAK